MESITAMLCDVPGISVEIENVVVRPAVTDAETYEGEYDVLPGREELRLPSARRYLEKDIRILPVPYIEQPNESGGTTVVIAGQQKG